MKIFLKLLLQFALSVAGTRSAVLVSTVWRDAASFTTPSTASSRSPLTKLLASGASTVTSRTPTLSPGWTASELRLPPRLSHICGRPSNKSYVCNPDGVIDKAKVEYMNVLLAGFRRSPCVCGDCTQKFPGFLFYLVAVSDALNENGSRMTSATDLERWNSAVLRAWRDKHCNRTVLISYSKRLNQISVLLEHLPGQQLATCVDSVISSAQRHLLQGESEKAISTVIGQLRLILAGYRTYCRENPFDEFSSTSSMYIGIIVSFVVLAALTTVVLVYWCRNPKEAAGMDALPNMVRAAIRVTRQPEHEALIKDPRRQEDEGYHAKGKGQVISKKDKPGYWRRTPAASCADDRRSHPERVRVTSLSSY